MLQLLLQPCPGAATFPAAQRDAGSARSGRHARTDPSPGRHWERRCHFCTDGFAAGHELWAVTAAAEERRAAPGAAAGALGAGGAGRAARGEDTGRVGGCRLSRHVEPWAGLPFAQEPHSVTGITQTRLSAPAPAPPQ